MNLRKVVTRRRRKVHRGWLIVVLAASAALLAPQSTHAQGLSGALSSTTNKAAAPDQKAADWLGRTTPRSAVYGFLEAAHAADYAKAAQYLDLTKMSAWRQTKEGPQLARELSQLLDRDPHFEIESLNNTPQGSAGDELAPDVDRLATFIVNGRTVTLYLQQEQRAGQTIWLVSPESVAQLPQLQSLTQSSPIEKLLPAPLVRIQLLTTPLWVWISLLLMAFALAFVSRLLSSAAIALLTPLVTHYFKTLATVRLRTFTEPVRLLLSIAAFRAFMEFAPPSALVRDFVIRVLQFLFVLGAASLLMRIVDLISDRFIAKLDPRERAMSFSVLPLGVRFIKICIFCLALLAVLRQWGIDITAVLAGVGVGGLAVALAAQRTIENLFGGISVISDRPVLVGDVCQFGGQLGTVEDIGLRSTRIRTLDRTLVTVPNSQFSTMTLENFSRRDRFWFHPVLQLRRDTSPDKIEEAMAAIGRVLESYENVDPTKLPVRFTKVTPEAFVLEVFAYVQVADSTEFMRVQSALLLKLLRTLGQIGVGLAVPMQESVTADTSAQPEREATEPSLLN